MKYQKWLLPAFLTLEGFLYFLILTSHGTTLIVAEYISIILCFLYGLFCVGKENIWIVCGLAFTVIADFFLVVCDPIEQLWGMMAFSVTQIFYAITLHKHTANHALLLIRCGLLLVAECVAVVVLREKTDLLALISVFYYGNLVMNLVEANIRFRNGALLAIGLILFLLCDTVIGLQVAAGGYLPIPEGSILHKILFMDFHLSWFFYLPSQVLIALQAGQKGRTA